MRAAAQSRLSLDLFDPCFCPLLPLDTASRSAAVAVMRADLLGVRAARSQPPGVPPAATPARGRKKELGTRPVAS